MTKTKRADEGSGGESIENVSPERAAEMQRILMTAMSALSSAQSPQDAQRILREAAALVPHLWATSEVKTALQIGIQLGRARAEAGAGTAACVGYVDSDGVDHPCGKILHRKGALGRAPGRCDECRQQHRREVRKLWARDHAKHKNKLDPLIDALENATYASSETEAAAAIRDAIGEVTDGASNGGAAADIVARVARRGGRPDGK